ncbi:hypothetical protein BDC45DRAFT_607783 [Circinella umbellata]|nr:hypothetical protein BDC45DRAFT_607783 [Circinella umbellata]
MNFTLLEDWIDNILMLTLKKVKNISKTVVQNCMRRQHHQQQQHHRLDPVYILPIEILNEIFILLPQDTKITLCLDVSKVWRETILKCPNVWRKIEIHQDNRVIQSCYEVGFHVKHMRIYSTLEEAGAASIQQLKEGYFKQIQSLKIRVPELQDTQKYIRLTRSALYQIRDTLTSFTIDTSKTGKYISIANILSSCNNLIELDYSTTTQLSEHRMINSYFIQYQGVRHRYNRSLLSLQLKAPVITRHDIEPLLEQCTELRRLVMSGCTTSVLDTILYKQQQHSPTPLNLEILGYNANSKSTPVPQLPKETMTWKGKEKKIKGLRILFTSSNARPVRTQSMIPLLYQNRETLVYILTHLSPLDQSGLIEMDTLYPNFELPNISRLTFWSVEGIQEFMLRAIRNSTRLSVLDIIHAYDIDAVLKVLTIMPPLKHLTVLYSTAPIPETYIDDYLATTVATTSLISLFKRYVYLSSSTSSSSSTTTTYSSSSSSSSLSSSSSTSTSSSSSSSSSTSSFSTITTKTIMTATMLPAPSRQFVYTPPTASFKSITLGKFNTISDRELSILGNIKTLQQFTLLDLNNVTTNGIKNLINKLGNQLKHVRLSRMESVTDDILFILGDMNELIRIALDYLPKVTNRGLQLLIDKLYLKLPQQQVELSVFYCPLITQKSIRYGKQKIKKFKASPCL